MTPYRERREKGHYNPRGEKPQSTHSHHLTGLATAPNPQTAKAALKETAKTETKPKKK